MKARKYLFTAGISSAETAAIAAFVRASQASLDATWALGGDDDAVDFVLVDLADFGGRCARVRAMDEGNHFAALANPGDDVLGTELVLYRPLDAKGIVGLLNHAGQAAPAERRKPVDFSSQLDAFASIPLAPRPPAREKPVVVGSDSPQRASFLEGCRERPCTDLDALLKRGALLIEREGLPPLLIDPVTETFHTQARLAELEPYFLEIVQGHERKSVGGMQLGALRKALPGQPLARLRWLHALLRSNGWLAPHLDPSADYRLRSWLPLDADYRKQHRIALTLFRAAPLHRIAASAKAHMADVFDVVNAYDALGLIEATRQPMADEDAQAVRKRTRFARPRRLLAAAAVVR